MNEYNPFAAPSVQGDVARPHDPDLPVDFASLRATGTGLTIIYVTILLQVLLGFTGAGFGILAPRIGIAANFFMLIMASVIAGILITILKLTGMIFCTTVPSASGAKSWIISSLVVQIAGFALTFLSGFLGIAPGTTWMSSFLISTIATVPFMIFLQKLGTHMQRSDMTRRARRVLILIIIGVVGGLVAFAGGIVSRINFRGPVGIIWNDFGLLLLMVFAAIYTLVVFLMYANVINAFGKYIRTPDASFPRNHLG